MKEYRVYVIDITKDDISDNLAENITDESYLDNETFMTIAEKQETVYTLLGFQTAFNADDLNCGNSYIRIIEI